MTDRKTYKAHENGGTTNTTPSCKSEALRYATELGWTVFPVPPGTKKSHKSKKHSNGINWGATNDPEQIERDFKKWPKANVGVPTGDGKFVIDADTVAGHGVDGITNFQNLIDANSPLTETRMAKSPTGSKHYYFKCPEGVRIINSDSKLAPGVDVRGEGGMVLAPPSIKPGVGTYEWICEADIADAPQWLINLVIEKEGERTPGVAPETESRIDTVLIEALAALPNPTAGWGEWKQVGMRIHKRTNGSADGFDAFNKWSLKNPEKYHADETRTAWEEITNSPPTDYDADSILRLADEVAPGWRVTIGFPPEQSAEIRRLAALTLVQYDIERKTAAEGLGIRTSTLDALVENVREAKVTPAKHVARMLPWRETRQNGSPIASFYNVRLGIIAMGIDVRHDLFRDVTIIGFKGDKIIHEVRPMIGELTNSALLRLRLLFSERYHFDPRDEYILDAVKSLAYENCFDPILDMLTEAEGNWDSTKRLDTWVVDYLGCEDTPLNRAIGRKVLIAAVHRARDPGCKFDYITVLEGPEGKYKSTAIRVLAGDDFFSDQSILGARDKEIQEQLSGVWMHESADLTGLKKAEVNAVKAFASRQVDRARPAYGRVVENKKRRSIDWATTNDEEYLQSQTGNRRFWPLAVGVIDIEALKRDRLLIFGEAARAESAGESMMLGEELRPAAEKAQEKRRTKDLWEDLIDEMTYAGATLSDNSIAWNAVIHLIDGQERVATSDILDKVLQIPPAQQSRDLSMRLSNVIKQLGWQRDGENKITIIKGQKQVRGYYRPAGMASVQTVTVLSKGEDTTVADGIKTAGYEVVEHMEEVWIKGKNKGQVDATQITLVKSLPPELLERIKSDPAGGLGNDPRDYLARRGRHYDYRARRRVARRRSAG
jgi:predicted P-loop ATPase